MKIRTLKTALLAGVFAAGLSGAAIAATDDTPLMQGTYLRLGAGITFPETYGAQEATSFGPAPASVDFNTGYNIIGAFGYEWASGIRTEAELGFRHADIESINGVGTGSGSARVGSAMVNALYDFHIGSSLVPYVGGGIGAGHEQWTNAYEIPGVVPGGHMGDTRFQWQLIAGLQLPVSQRVSVFTEYRYIDLNDPQFRDFGPGNLAGNYDNHSNNILAGLRFHLGG